MNQNNAKKDLASMEEDKKREMASMSGKAAHEKGTINELGSKEAAPMGEKATHEKGTAHEFESEKAQRTDQ